MLMRCATCSDWGRTSSRDATGDRWEPASRAGSDGVRAHPPARPPDLRRAAHERPASVLLRVGSRGSRLALTQAERAADALRRPGVEIALVPITTAGDRDRTSPFGEIGSRGVFVKELEEALLEGRIDVAVHSAKDMTRPTPRASPSARTHEREDPRDALCGADAIRPGMRIGTASARREAQLLALEPTLSIEPLRGNIDTRLRKRGERGLDAIDARRLRSRPFRARAPRSALRLDPDVMLPEAGQGALALQVRAGEEDLVARADDGETRTRVEAERRCVALVGGGCLAPVAAFHDGSVLTGLIAARGRCLARAAQRVRIPAAIAAELLAARTMRLIVTRPAGQEHDLIVRLEALGHEVVHCPLIRDRAALGRARSTSRGTTGSSSRARTAPASCSAARADRCRVSPRSGRRRPSAMRTAPISSPRVSTQEGLARGDAPSGRARPRGGCGGCPPAPGRQRSLRTSCRSIERTRFTPIRHLSAISACSHLPRPRARSVRSPPRIPAITIGPETTPGGARRRIEVLAEATTHDLDGLVTAVGGCRARLSRNGRRVRRTAS